MTANSFFTVTLLIFTGQFINAQNPILWDTASNILYAADPAAGVYNGKVYVYCSHDQPDAVSYSSMQDYIVLETEDMENWTKPL